MLCVRHRESRSASVEFIRHEKRKRDPLRTLRLIQSREDPTAEITKPSAGIAVLPVKSLTATTLFMTNIFNRLEEIRRPTASLTLFYTGRYHLRFPSQAGIIA
jgi:hypothetical protein